MNYSIGDIVCSIAGRDKGQIYIIWGIEDKNLLLVNGKQRKINCPKKKNLNHIRFIEKSEKLQNQQDDKKINDSYLRKILAKKI